MKKNDSFLSLLMNHASNFRNGEHADELIIAEVTPGSQPQVKYS